MKKKKSFLSYSLTRFILGTPSDFRENTKVIVAASLAAGCWITFGVLIHTQFSASREAANKIIAFADAKKAPAPEDEKRINIIKDANNVVNQTANSIYALLSPVAAGITGFFFVSSGFKKNAGFADEDSEDDSSTVKKNLSQKNDEPLDKEGNTTKGSSSQEITKPVVLDEEGNTIEK
jgi:phosphate/sulfate permease